MANYTKAEAGAAAPDRPMPQIDADSAPFWAGCREGELRIPLCSDCGHRFMPPRGLCPRCHSQTIAWQPVPLRGTVYTAVTFHHAFHPAFKGDVPYNVSLIELEGGVRIWSNVVGCKPDDVRIGMPVAAFFEPVSADLALPRFRPLAT